MKPTILALETASERCSVALHNDGHIYVRESEQPRGHADLVLNMVHEVLAEAKTELSELDALAFSKGPGAFTSIRIGTSVVQGLAMGTGLSVASASSLEILALTQSKQEAAVILTALDARMNEVYFGAYQIQNGRAVALQKDQVSKPSEIVFNWNESTPMIAIGSGWQAYPNEMAERFKDLELLSIDEKYPHARELLSISFEQYTQGLLVSADQILPVYIRDKVTHGS